MLRMRHAGMALLIAALTACASAGNTNVSRSTRQDRLTRDEIMSVQVSNLYEVVRRLRPQWLEVNRRGDRSFGLTTGIVVFQNQTYLGDVDVLRQFSPETAYQLQWLDGSTASNSLPGLGSQHVAGAIVIKTSGAG